jgi:CDP-diglyceride synthetase
VANATTGRRTRGWIRDVVVGGLVGGVVGAIVAVNVVIYAGIERGYEAGLGDVFRQNAFVGLLVVVVLVVAPVFGFLTAHRIRRRR